MVIFYYLHLILPLIGLFAMGYITVALIVRFLQKQRLIRADDVYANAAGALGLVAGFLLLGLFGLDRFAFASDRIRISWVESALSYEMMQSYFSGLICAIIVVSIDFYFASANRFRGILKFVMVLFASFFSFVLWPTVVSLFV